MEKGVLSSDTSKMHTSHIKGLESGALLAVHIKRELVRHFPNLWERSCLALVGVGSECLGFDDTISEDHDFFVRCQLFLTESDYASYETMLSGHFKNFPHGRVEIHSIPRFYKYYTFFEEGPQTIWEYNKVPSDCLCVATNGIVYYDELGEFSRIRERLLAFYPEEIRRKKIADSLRRIATAKTCYSQMLQRQDIITASLAQADFMQQYLELVHLLNKRYVPFYKWIYRNAFSLTVLGAFTKDILSSYTKSPTDQKMAFMEMIILEIVKTLQEEELVCSNATDLHVQADYIHKGDDT